MKAVLAQFLYEANTFCAQPSDLDNFKKAGLWLEDEEAIRHWARGRDTQMSGSLKVLDAAGWQTVPVFVCVGGAALGVLTADCFHAIREIFRRRIARALPADVLVLHLHGAASAEGEDDVDGNLLAMVRHEIGYRGRLVLSLDLHANVTRQMLQLADAVTAYRTMPHCDFGATGERAARLVLKNQPAVRALAKIAALVPPTDQDHRKGRFHQILQQARAAEQLPDIDDVGLFPVQPWLDIAEMGSSVVVTGRGTEPARVARDLAERWYAQRHEWQNGLQSMDAVLEKLRTRNSRLWFLVDTADCVTGGSSGTSAYILQNLLPMADALPGPVLLHIVDPHTVEQARKGATRFSIGHPSCPLEAKVVQLGEGTYTVRGPFFGGVEFSMCGAAVLRQGNLFVVVAAKPTLGIDPALYECVGLDPARAHAVHVRSLMGWRVNFGAEDSQALLFDGPGSTSMNFQALPFTGERRNLFPINPNPKDPIQPWQST